MITATLTVFTTTTKNKANKNTDRIKIMKFTVISQDSEVISVLLNYYF